MNDYILNELIKLIPSPVCELTYNKDYELLLKVMLSARTTDKIVNKVMNPIFEKYDSLEKLNNIPLKELEKYLKPIGTYKVKAKRFKEIVSILLPINKVPIDEEFLLTLPGVGRKTINVVLSNLYGTDRVAVDTHVERVSKRLGLAFINDTPLKVENKLTKKYKNNLKDLHNRLVLFGRYTCTSKKPKCKECPFIDICKEKNKNL